ncbi:hypothetical protein QVD17_05590 [Tagetes erecta]|uniref:Transmembrane protein n=1 Tax=Tagetes erecta TaxID=13708 RepID=A0AAD8P5M6_TARER|nr:hypothetical protein QVD17_05590 [Tagetes erecta]
MRRSKLDEPFYSIFIFIIIIISSLFQLPLQIQSFASNFAKFVDANDRHYIFLLCNGIVFFLFVYNGSNQAGAEAKEIKCDEISVSIVDDVNGHVEDLETKHVQNEHECVMEVKQIEQNGMLVGVNDADDHAEIELVRDVDYEHEIVVCEVEDDEYDDDDDGDDEFRQKCEEFIKKVRRSMQCEGELISN